ncbi:acetyltransferase family protein [Acetobacter nitrogenifigens DSM 23921 = NBRC 105050]|uniref:N-acetyltransferase n=1 Tax=Acetobacter nitrogenifigens DSM 23921 = NBRC 105050 TaxID=1120919 RepID=A0A511XBG2_9PROT|nr:GNAT family N-acetyltransferase [Acetobacter nitrogenifigens]GBQ90762.1 acetyltransferase family protein [Acetobacter nitrogenifigens DSM 23921 = NBRC 105050]GEN60262.1 N-acetyltransferase [Acetobacter nitrogenifigens DSM 23921 = NBRC 105050]
MSFNVTDDHPLPDGYALHVGVPDVAAYCRLRTTSGLTPRSLQAARTGLPNTLYGVHVAHGSDIVGMGRMIGDGALFIHIVDIAVEPAHHGQGIGSAIVGAIMRHIRAVIPAETYVSLMANGGAWRLYERFGFENVFPDARGMATWISAQ